MQAAAFTMGKWPDLGSGATIRPVSLLTVCVGFIGAVGL